MNEDDTTAANLRQYLKLHMNITWAFKVTFILFAVFGIISLVIVIYAMYFEDPFVRYQNLPFPVQSGKVEQGKAVPIQIERCNDSGTQRVYVSSRTLKNADTGKEYVLPESTVSIKSGCTRILSRSVVIPVDTPPGLYTIEGEAITEGLLKRHHVEWYTEKFEVVKATPLLKQLQQEQADLPEKGGI